MSKAIETKNIPGWPGYQATSDGYIISHKWREARVLKAQKNRDGYLQLSLCQNGKVKTRLIHMLITLVYLGDRPKGMEINHIDHNKLNNNRTNLEYISSRENTTHYYLNQQSSSKYTGVNWAKRQKKYKAIFGIGQKLHYLGYFDKEIDAHHKYQSCLRDYNAGKAILGGNNVKGNT